MLHGCGGPLFYKHTKRIVLFVVLLACLLATKSNSIILPLADDDVDADAVVVVGMPANNILIIQLKFRLF